MPSRGPPARMRKFGAVFFVCENSRAVDRAKLCLLPALDTLKNKMAPRENMWNEQADPARPSDPIRVLLIADSASSRFGGEAIHPIHYFRILRSRGIETWMIVHGRTRAELEEMFPGDVDRIHYIDDSLFQKVLWQIERLLPHMLGFFTIGTLRRLTTQFAARRIARRLVAEHQIDVVHQPIPLSPKEWSAIYDVAAPVVIGPLNGGMTFPNAFRKRQSMLEAAFMTVGRWASDTMNRLVPGKLRAACVLIANERTRAALPKGMHRKARFLIDNCVDLSTWKPPATSERPSQSDGIARFIYLGRLVDWKAVDILLDAFEKVAKESTARLDIIGDGAWRERLEKQSAALGISSRVTFKGWLTQAQCASELSRADALVLPSLYECGGAVVLEAMGVGLPVIASNWGGPADYITETCGILVNPTSKEDFKNGLSEGMLRLAKNPEMRLSLGKAARRRVEEHFDWQRKVDRTLQIYHDVIQSRQSTQDQTDDAADMPQTIGNM
jgi:glycosyltransferase involved in cell wall biosynthesis